MEALAAVVLVEALARVEDTEVVMALEGLEAVEVVEGLASVASVASDLALDRVEGPVATAPAMVDREAVRMVLAAVAVQEVLAMAMAMGDAVDPAASPLEGGHGSGVISWKISLQGRRRRVGSFRLWWKRGQRLWRWTRWSQWLWTWWRIWTRWSQWLWTWWC